MISKKKDEGEGHFEEIENKGEKRTTGKKESCKRIDSCIEIGQKCSNIEDIESVKDKLERRRIKRQNKSERGGGKREERYYRPCTVPEEVVPGVIEVRKDDLFRQWFYNRSI